MEKERCEKAYNAILEVFEDYCMLVHRHTIDSPVDSLQLEYNDGEVTLIEHVYDFFCKNDD